MNQPAQFGKYYLLERINVGGMAEVFKAKAFGVEGFERLIAVKRILPNIAEDEEFITMFIDEAKIAVQLQHANIAQIFDLGKVDDSYFIALEYVSGKDLRAIFDHLRRHEGTMPTAQACFIVMQVCEGLDYAHNKRDPQGRELNLVHRDVSPQNVLIGYEGEIKLVDFGIAKAAGKASKTQAGILKGKFGYMSPEQVRGLPVDRRSDIFSLGIVLYELLTGERLFVGESDFSTLEKVRNVEILPPSSFNRKLPAELERIVLKALAKDVEDRYQNAIDLHDDLQAFLYSVGEFYSRKDLSGWMKKTFAAELTESSANLVPYEQFEEPTPAPVIGGALPASESPPQMASDALEWDDEELETQIFDKPPDAQLLGAERAQELSSSEIFLADSGDDKTVAGAPPEELLAAEAAQAPRSNSSAALRTTSGYGAGTPFSGGSAPSAAVRPVGASPSGSMRPVGAGPPPGLGAFRQTPMSPYGTFPPSPSLPGGFADGQPPPPRPTGAFNLPTQQPPYRPTLSGLAAAQAPAAALGDRGYAPARQVGGRGRLWAVLGVVVVVAAGGAAYFQLTRPGKVQIEIDPADAQVTINGTPVEGASPITISRPRGVYRLSVTRDGYVREDRDIEIEAGHSARVDVDLQPSPDTGFELTSDPPGGLVWLDGKPFMTPEDPPQQARTNFKAYRVAPGRHTLEIKGDPRYEDWRLDFIQDPGRIRKITAELKARAGSAVAAAPPAPPRPSPPPEARPVEEPPPPAKVAEAPAEKPAPAPAPPPPPPAPVAAAEEKAPPRPRPAATVRSTTPPPRRVAQTSGSISGSKSAASSVAEDIFEKDSKPASAGVVEECTITVGSKPWSEVWIDGKNTGKVTPLVDHKVPCGRRKLTFKNPDLPVVKSETITVTAGEKFKKVFSLVDTEE